MGSGVLDVERDSANAWEPVASTTAPTAHHAAYRITARKAVCHQGFRLGKDMASILMSLASRHKLNIDLSSRSDYPASTGAVRQQRSHAYGLAREDKANRTVGAGLGRACHDRHAGLVHAEPIPTGPPGRHLPRRP